jgi:hypothetical protein
MERNLTPIPPICWVDCLDVFAGGQCRTKLDTQLDKTRQNLTLRNKLGAWGRLGVTKRAPSQVLLLGGSNLF